MTPVAIQNRREKHHVQNITPDSAHKQHQRAQAVATKKFQQLHIAHQMLTGIMVTDGYMETGADSRAYTSVQ